MAKRAPSIDLGPGPKRPRETPTSLEDYWISGRANYRAFREAVSRGPSSLQFLPLDSFMHPDLVETTPDDTPSVYLWQVQIQLKDEYLCWLRRVIEQLETDRAKQLERFPAHEQDHPDDAKDDENNEDEDDGEENNDNEDEDEDEDSQGDGEGACSSECSARRTRTGASHFQSRVRPRQGRRSHRKQTLWQREMVCEQTCLSVCPLQPRRPCQHLLATTLQRGPPAGLA
jgi:hypothetical protein